MQSGLSGIIVNTDMNLIVMNLPAYVKLLEQKLIFSIDVDGVDMGTFYNKVEEYEETILLIETNNNEIIGCFMAENWHRSRKNEFYGNGDYSFLFRLVRREDNEQSAVDKKLEAIDIEIYDPTF